MRYARFEKNNTVACGIIEGDTIKLIAGEILDGGAPTGEPRQQSCLELELES